MTNDQGQPVGSLVGWVPASACAQVVETRDDLIHAGGGLDRQSRYEGLVDVGVGRGIVLQQIRGMPNHLDGSRRASEIERQIEIDGH